MTDANAMFHLAGRIANILEAMRWAKMINMDEEIQLKRVIDVAIDRWFEED